MFPDGWNSQVLLFRNYLFFFTFEAENLSENAVKVDGLIEISKWKNAGGGKKLLSSDNNRIYLYIYLIQQQQQQQQQTQKNERIVRLQIISQAISTSIMHLKMR